MACLHYWPRGEGPAVGSGARARQETRTWVPDASSRKNGGPGLESGRRREQDASAAPRHGVRTVAPGIARAVSAAAQSRSYGVRVRRLKPSGPSDRTATEARVRSPSVESAFQAEPERWSGIRTRDPMIKSHLLFPTELSSWRFVSAGTREPQGGARRPGPRRARTCSRRRNGASL